MFSSPIAPGREKTHFRSACHSLWALSHRLCKKKQTANILVMKNNWIYPSTAALGIALAAYAYISSAANETSAGTATNAPVAAVVETQVETATNAPVTTGAEDSAGTATNAPVAAVVETQVETAADALGTTAADDLTSGSKVPVENSAGDGGKYAPKESIASSQNLAIFVLGFLLLLMILLNWWMYRWRKYLVENAGNQIVVPESFWKEHQEQSKEYQNLQNLVARMFEGLGAMFNKTVEQGQDLSESFMTLQTALGDLQTENKRLKSGYDLWLVEKFLRRFIKVDQALKESIAEEDLDPDELNDVAELMQDALEDCGVYMFAPEIGEDYRDAFGVADRPKTTPAPTKDDEFRVIEILDTGYLQKNGDQRKCIIKAKVRIYDKFDDSSNNDVTTGTEEGESTKNEVSANG